MKKKLKFILGVLSCVSVVQLPAQETSLWYDAPADEWMKSLPVGNGRVGSHGLWWCRRRDGGTE